MAIRQGGPVALEAASYDVSLLQQYLDVAMANDDTVRDDAVEAATKLAARKVSPDYSPQANALFKAHPNNQSDATKKAVDDLIRKLRIAGVWNKLERLHLPMSTLAASLINVCKPTGAPMIVNGTVTFTALRGWTGNGVDGYLSAPENLTDATLFSLNSASAFVYCNQASGNAGAKPQLGATGSNSTSITPSSANNELGQLNDADGNLGAGPRGRDGSRLLTRTNGANKRLYVNGVSVFGNVAVASSVVPAQPLSIFRRGASYGDDRIGAFGIGAGLNDNQAVAFQNALHEFMTAIGANYA